VSLLDDLSELAEHERCQSHPFATQETPGKLGVEEGIGSQPHVRKARKVLGRRVQDPLRTADGLLEGSEVRQCDRVDQCRASACAPDLDEVGTLAVTEARGAFCIDRDGPGAAGETGTVGTE
jgi:hypothetical protein